MPELSLSLDLHLHDSAVCLLNAIQLSLDFREEVDDLLFTQKDFTTNKRHKGIGIFHKNKKNNKKMLVFVYKLVAG